MPSSSYVTALIMRNHSLEFGSCSTLKRWSEIYTNFPTAIKLVSRYRTQETWNIDICTYIMYLDWKNDLKKINITIILLGLVSLKNSWIIQVALLLIISSLFNNKSWLILKKKYIRNSIQGFSISITFTLVWYKWVPKFRSKKT